MIRLYRDMEHPESWIAYLPETGWMRFPAQEHGWEQRQPAHGLDPIHLRQVPIYLAANTGLKPSGDRPAFAEVAARGTPDASRACLDEVDAVRLLVAARRRGLSPGRSHPSKGQRSCEPERNLASC